MKSALIVTFVAIGQASALNPMSLFKRAPDAPFSGDGTFYYPNGGTGACGTTLQNTDHICALSFAQIDSVPCNTCIRVTGPKGAVTVRVMDKCEGCKWGDVDLSHGAFIQIADEDAGRVPVTAVIADCASGVAVAGSPSLSLNLGQGAAKLEQPAAEPAAPPQQPPQQQQQQSPAENNDGRCGAYFGGAICAPGECCSTYGYCGTTAEYCGTSTVKRPAIVKSAAPAAPVSEPTYAHLTPADQPVPCDPRTAEPLVLAQKVAAEAPNVPYGESSVENAAASIELPSLIGVAMGYLLMAML